MKNTNFVKYFVLICLISLIRAQDKQEGDACTVTLTGRDGVCKFLSSCPSAQDDLRDNARRPTICGYVNFRKVVCCPNPDPVVEIVTKTTESKAVQKCKEYGKYAFVNISLLLTDTNSNAIQKSIDGCGHIATPFILGAKPAASREFPHSALLGYRHLDGTTISWDCGGSLVSSRYVLTAGHGLTSPDYGDVVKVRLGELILNDETDDAVEDDIDVEKIIPHPDYVRTSRYNDIALLKLVRKAKLSPYVRPICLPTVDEDPQKTIATGWGAIELGGTTRGSVLSKVVLETFSNTECNEMYQHNLDRKLRNGIIEKQMCAGSRIEKKDTCLGDSGFPLQIFNNDVNCTYTQVGITSFGIGCGILNFPAVYTRVYNYVDWIENIIWAPGEDE